MWKWVCIHLSVCVGVCLNVRFSVWPNVWMLACVFSCLSCVKALGGIWGDVQSGQWEASVITAPRSFQNVTSALLNLLNMSRMNLWRAIELWLRLRLRKTQDMLRRHWWCVQRTICFCSEGTVWNKLEWLSDVSLFLQLWIHVVGYSYFALFVARSDSRMLDLCAIPMFAFPASRSIVCML